MTNTDEKIAMRVSFVSIVANIILTIFKLIAGIFSHSSAMISDAVHSASDVFSTFIVILGVKLSNKKADKEHPYGHERLECVASLILAIMLFATGLGIGVAGVENIKRSELLLVPGILALVAAITSILVKEAMYWYTRNAAKKINSGALLADAWHHRSDALSSIGSLIGIVGSRLGFPILDPIASVVICLFILKVAIDIFKDSIDKMVDKSCSIDMLNQILDVVSSCDKVVKVDDLKTRLFGNKVYMDIEIEVDQTMNIMDAHSVAEEVHDKIEEKIPFIKHCMVHVNPAENKIESE